MLEFEVNIVSYKHPHLTRALANQLRETLPFHPHIRIWENSPEKYDYGTYGTLADEIYWMRFNPSLSRVWNWAIAQSASERVLIASDDIRLKSAWFELLEAECDAFPESLWHGPSRFFLFNKKLLKSVGWFDENLCGNTYEDLDYIRRMNHTGVPHTYGPLSSLQSTAETLKGEIDRPLYPHSNFIYFQRKYNDHNTENFICTPNFETPNFYPQIP